MSRTSYSIREISEIICAKTEFAHDEMIKDLLTDSRTYHGGEGFLFFALKTAKNDGHKFISELYRKGVRSFVVSDPNLLNSFADANFLLVEDSLKALQKLAAAHRQKFSYPMVGITGSNGKTIVKEWLFQLLQADISVVRSPRSYNSQVGVPLSLWLLNEEREMALIECGISRKGEMEELEKMVKPTVGIFTNIGPAHQENFESFREKAIEKLALFQESETLIYCRDHEVIHEIADKRYKGKCLTWGENSEADMVISEIRKDVEKTKIRARFRGKDIEATIPFSDDASIENACHCWLMLLYLGVNNKEIAVRLSKLNPIAMRLEKRDGLNRCTVINDSYNSDLASLDIALDFLSMQAQGRKKVLILSDILQSGENAESLYSKVADIIIRKGVSRLIAIGSEIIMHGKLFDRLKVEKYPDTESFLESFQESHFDNEAILVKGARTFRFERIVNRLEAKMHETVLEIDLNKMNQNLDYIRSILRPATKIMAMVKAFAYGSGSTEVAAALEYAGVEYLAVAYADEGVALREAGIKLPIMVLNPESIAYDMMIRYDLEPQIYSFYTLAKFIDALAVHSEKTPYPIHVKINSGMNRLGFDSYQMTELAKKLNELEDSISVKSVFSHLAGSDEEEFDELTKSQISRYEECCKDLINAGVRGFMKHILNSNGILRHPEAQMDMVRLGLGLYGLSSNEAFREKLKPISRLKTNLSQIRLTPAGEGVGYSPKSNLEEETRIGVIAMGYADGLPRILGNGHGRVWINGKTAPFIGNICMDMSMIDLTGIEASEGDEVEIFGDHNSIYAMAERQKTIPYEVLTNISERVKRVFYKE
jgi:alanine racemase